MPTYSYQCQSCGHQFDKYQSIKADALTDCPECSEPSLKRLLGTGSAVLFKGSGFYTTDYRSESYKKRAAADSPSGGESTAGTEGKAAEATATDGSLSDKKPNGDKSPAASDKSSNSETGQSQPASSGQDSSSQTNNTSGEKAST